MYRNWTGTSIERESVCSGLTWGATLLLLIAVGRVSEYTTELSGKGLMLWFAATPLTGITGRIWVRIMQRHAVRSGWYSRGCAIVGINDLGVQLANNLLQSSDLGFQLSGFYDDRPATRTANIPAHLKPRMGELGQMFEDARAGRISTVFITLPMRAEKRINQILSRLADTTVSVYIVPDFFVFELLHSRWTDVNGLPVVSLFESPVYGIDGLAKRVVDLALASLALLMAGVPMFLIAALIKLTSRGPVFFRQKRYGLDGKEIYVWKFRSMTVCENGAEVKQATKNDSRITPLGNFLRKSSLDELPQLLNVIMGNMSMVGPRPHATAHNELYRTQIQGYMLRHKIKPGITGLAQVSGFRGETDTLDKMEGRIRYDHQYIREWSIWLDLKIIAKTFLVVLARKNAY
jgi:putative colanic acid biosynthesis UDP-glucose lipid carrier transferase